MRDTAIKTLLIGTAFVLTAIVTAQTTNANFTINPGKSVQFKENANARGGLVQLACNGAALEVTFQPQLKLPSGANVPVNYRFDNSATVNERWNVGPFGGTLFLPSNLTRRFLTLGADASTLVVRFTDANKNARQFGFNVTGLRDAIGTLSCATQYGFAPANTLSGTGGTDANMTNNGMTNTTPSSTTDNTSTGGLGDAPATPAPSNNTSAINGSRQTGVVIDRNMAFISPTEFVRAFSGTFQPEGNFLAWEYNGVKLLLSKNSAAVQSVYDNRSITLMRPISEINARTVVPASLVSAFSCRIVGITKPTDATVRIGCGAGQTYQEENLLRY
jgi:hypothetical protein